MTVLRDAGWVFLVTMWVLTICLGPAAYTFFWLAVTALASVACVCFVKAVWHVE